MSIVFGEFLPESTYSMSVPRSVGVCRIIESAAVSDFPFPLTPLGCQIQTTFVARALPSRMKTSEGLVPARD